MAESCKLWKNTKQLPNIKFVSLLRCTVNWCPEPGTEGGESVPSQARKLENTSPILSLPELQRVSDRSRAEDTDYLRVSRLSPRTKLGLWGRKRIFTALTGHEDQHAGGRASSEWSPVKRDS